ncbi:M56 family metallopeptidase [Paraflavisolibacter sp. H34]|uniref:M56 family metallopeptidase n=1 Tax=Huijunlia imazamoxiresistens TaxID=3127457 RepID=UPI0030181538
MNEVSQSLFLQALGWAMISSLGQMAFLWCGFAAARQVVRLSPRAAYNLAVAAIATGFVLFGTTFLACYLQEEPMGLPLLPFRWNASSGLVTVCLTAASLTYLLLLFVPAFRLLANWRSVQRLKTQGLVKAPVAQRLFLKKTSSLFRLKQPVQLFLSERTTSPVLIGFLKPVILLPVACLNQLSLQQVEAIILHELAHICRRDYLVNFFLSIAQTLLYFNPFVRLFLQVAEREREHCCDELVLQFGYDKASYASALLTLERASARTPVLAMGATGRKSLLARIERIAGLEKKPSFSLNHLALLAGAVLGILTLNALLQPRPEVPQAPQLAFSHYTHPLSLLSEEASRPAASPAKKELPAPEKKVIVMVATAPVPAPLPVAAEEEEVLQLPPALLPVSYEEAGATLTPKEKKQVTATVEATRKVLTTVHWQEVETAIADGMTSEEKEAARRQYLQEVDKVDWKALEQLLKTDYDKIDWARINAWLAGAAITARLDSLETALEQEIIQLDKATRLPADSFGTAPAAPSPDLLQRKATLQNNLHLLRGLKEGKEVIKL